MPGAPIFLSYSRSDDTVVRTLLDVLEKEGMPAFKDNVSIQSGERWVERLQQALAECCAFVVLVGQDGIRRWVGAEVEFALRRHLSPQGGKKPLPIFPVLLDDTSAETMPPLLSLFQATRWRTVEPVPADLLAALNKPEVRFDEELRFEGCPFLGLDAFGEKDARLFFGRRRETLEALALLGDQGGANPEAIGLGGGGGYARWLQIEGSSGSGKSSLVGGGLLPLLRRGTLWARTGFTEWTVIGPMLPGGEPVRNLATALLPALADAGRQVATEALQQRLGSHDQALANCLREARRDGRAFLLVVDQFEELLTMAGESERRRLDVLLAEALTDDGCAFFLVSTVRADFLDRFGELPRLQAICNSHCRRYLLPAISEPGLREIVTEPARIAELDVTDVASAILAQARDEVGGALPLVENALRALWKVRKDGCLSGAEFRDRGGLAGILAEQADALLERIGKEVKGGEAGALKLLQRLARTADDGRHSRRRIERHDAVLTAGSGDETAGERVLNLLAGRRRPEVPAGGPSGALRLVTISEDGGRHYVDLIHETLIRARPGDRPAAERAYWPRLYRHLEDQQKQQGLRDELELHARRWREARGSGRWWYRAGLSDLWRYRPLEVDGWTPEGAFLRRSRVSAGVNAALLLLALAVVATLIEAKVWVAENSLPNAYIAEKLKWRVGIAPRMPDADFVKIKAAPFKMGCVKGRDDVDGDHCKDGDWKQVRNLRDFELGKFEVTYRQFDYFVWDEGHKLGIGYPSRGAETDPEHPVTNVSATEAQVFAIWLGRRTGGHDIRLPYEAEWEYAARAGTDTEYWYGPKFDPKGANCWGGPKRTVRKVGDFGEINQWGLSDMLGNVAEWTTGADGKSRVLRGGAWDLAPRGCRAANRFDYAPDYRVGDLGFRVCRGAPIDPPTTAPPDAEPPER